MYQLKVAIAMTDVGLEAEAEAESAKAAKNLPLHDWLWTKTYRVIIPNCVISFISQRINMVS